MQSLVFRCLRLVLAVLVLPSTAPVFAQPVDDRALETALGHFNRARHNDADQIEAAIAAFQAAPANPALQPLYSAYLGSAYTLRAKAAWLPWRKLNYTEQGLDHIDQALAALRSEHDRVLVQGTPASLVTRMTAAATFVALPDGIFHRRAAGHALLAELRRSPLLAAAPAGFRAELDALESRAREAGK